MTIKRIVAVVLACAAMALPRAARAQQTGCTLTGPMSLEIPRLNATGPQFTGCVQRAIAKISTAAAPGGPLSTSTFHMVHVDTIAGGAGGAGVYVSTPVSIAGSSGGYSLTLSTGLNMPAGQVTAKHLKGEGSQITDILEANVAGLPGHLAAIGVSTDTLSDDLATEISDRGLGDDLLGAATGAIRNDFTEGDILLGAATHALDLAKQGVFVGISSSCAAGYYLSSATWINGVVTGGGCVLAGTGSGAGGHKFSTAAYAGGPAYDLLDSTRIAWGPGFSVIPANGAAQPYDYIGIGTGDGLFTNISSGVLTGNPTGGNVAICSLTNSTRSITTRGGPLLVMGHWSGATGTANKSVGLRVRMDGADVTNEPYQTFDNNSGYWDLTLPSYVIPASAGTHSLCLAVRMDSTDAITQSASFGVVELAAQTAAISVPASTSTLIYDLAVTNTNANLCSSTISLVGNGGTLDVNFDGWATNSNADNGVYINYLINGQKSRFRTASGHPDSRKDYKTASFMSYIGFHGVESPAAGVVTICIAPHVSGYTGTLNGTFSVSERRNVAGTGDVASNGNTTFTGDNRITNKTKAELVGKTPAGVGEYYYCSDCSPKKLVISTGTSAGNFSDAAGGTFQ